MGNGMTVLELWDKFSGLIGAIMGQPSKLLADLKEAQRIPLWTKISSFSYQFLEKKVK